MIDSPGVKVASKTSEVNNVSSPGVKRQSPLRSPYKSIVMSVAASLLTVPSLVMVKLKSIISSSPRSIPFMADASVTLISGLMINISALASLDIVLTVQKPPISPKDGQNAEPDLKVWTNSS